MSAERQRRYRERQKAGNGELEVVLDGTQISAPLVKALDAMLAGAFAPAMLAGTPYVGVAPAAIDEAVVQTITNSGDEVLYVQTGQPRRREWTGVARFQQRSVGSHHFVAARPFRAAVNASVMGALEVAVGRPWDYAGPPANSTFERVLVDAAYVTSQGYTHVLWTKYRTAWFPIGRMIVPRRSGSHEPPPAPGPGRAYPNVDVT